jgi:hypothetical protein
MSERRSSGAKPARICRVHSFFGLRSPGQRFDHAGQDVISHWQNGNDPLKLQGGSAPCQCRYTSHESGPTAGESLVQPFSRYHSIPCSIPVYIPSTSPPTSRRPRYTYHRDETSSRHFHTPETRFTAPRSKPWICGVIPKA